MSNTIPKIIHQIWIQGKDKLPKNFIGNVDGLKKNLPSSLIIQRSKQLL